jgi:hypothetical protein
MSKRTTLALAVVVAILATVSTLAGPRDAGQIALSAEDNPAARGLASGGGNLVALW